MAGLYCRATEQSVFIRQPMPSKSDAQQFADRARENQLEISVAQAGEFGGFGEAVKAAISTIREIDSAGFEPAAIFVPTRSGMGYSSDRKPD